MGLDYTLPIDDDWNKTMNLNIAPVNTLTTISTISSDYDISNYISITSEKNMEDILDSYDIEEIENYIRKKKLEKITKR